MSLLLVLKRRLVVIHLISRLILLFVYAVFFESVAV